MDAIAHAMYFLFPLFLYQLLVKVLVAILVVNLPEVVDLVDQREIQDHRGKFYLVEMDN